MFPYLCFGQEGRGGAETGKKEGPPPPSSLPYEYRSQDKLDPFVPFKSMTKRGQMLPVAGIGSSEPIQGGMPLVSMSDLRLTGIVKKGLEIMAVLTGPDGKGIFVKEGSKVGKEGAVVSAILFEDKETAAGITQIRKVILRVPINKGDGREDFNEIELVMGSPETK